MCRLLIEDHPVTARVWYHIDWSNTARCLHSPKALLIRKGKIARVRGRGDSELTRHTCSDALLATRTRKTRIQLHDRAGFDVSTGENRHVRRINVRPVSCLLADIETVPRTVTEVV